MTDSNLDANLVYDQNLSAFRNKVNGNYYRMLNGEYKLINEIHLDSSSYVIKKGEIVLINNNQPHINPDVYPQPTVEDTVSQIDKDIFKLTWNRYLHKYRNSMEDIIKYLVVHPDQRPPGNDLILHKNNKKDRNKVLNPITNAKIKKGSKEYKLLLTVYDNPGGEDGESRAMIPIPENDINWYYVNSGDSDNGKLFKKIGANGKNTPKLTKLLEKSILRDNILFVPTIKTTSTSLNTNLKNFQIEPHIEMVIDGINGPIIRDIIYNGSKQEFVENHATTLLISFDLRLELQPDDHNQVVQPQFTTQYVTTITYKHNKEDFMSELLSDILKVQAKYHGSEHMHFILLMIKIASFNNILVGGCSLEITGLIDKKDTSTFFKYGDGYLRYVKNVADNNCLPIIFVERERTINKDKYVNRFPEIKERHSMEEKNTMINNLRTKLNLEPVGQMMSIASVNTLVKEFNINVKFIDMDLKFKCDGQPLEDIHIVLLNNHYFEYYPPNHQYYDIASRKYKHTYQELWQTYCNIAYPNAFPVDQVANQIDSTPIIEPIAPIIDAINEIAPIIDAVNEPIIDAVNEPIVEPIIEAVNEPISVATNEIASVKQDIMPRSKKFFKNDTMIGSKPVATLKLAKKVDTIIGPKIVIIPPQKKTDTIIGSKPIVDKSDKLTIIAEKKVVRKNTRSDFFRIGLNSKNADQKVAVDSNIVFLKVSLRPGTQIPTSYCFQHIDSIFNYSDENMGNKFIDYCLNNNIKNIVTYGGSTRDLFPLYHAINKHPIAKIGDSTFDLTYINSTFYTIRFNGISTCDLELFIKAEFGKVCKQLNIPVINDPSFFVSTLRYIFTLFEKETFAMYKCSILKYMTANSISYDFWTNTLELNNKGLSNIFKLTLSHYSIVIKSNYGAYFYPLKHYFKSKYNNINDVLLNLDFLRKIDVSGCYSYAMYNHIYPTGDSYALNKSDIANINDAIQRGVHKFKLGVYEVSYICPKKLRRPVLPKHDENGALLWDLIDGRGFFTSALISHAIKKGYRIIELHSGVIWSTSSTTIFNKFIETTYVLKQLYSHDIVRSNMAKQMCSGLYGKLLENIGDLKRTKCNNINDLIKSSNEDKPIDIIINNDDTVQIFSKDTIPNEKNIKKPYQLGVFVLDYARIYMDELVDFLDIDEVPFYSIFTDSIYITQKQFQKLENSSFIFKPIPNDLTESEDKKQWILNHQLGKLRDDLGGYIIEANFYRPNICRLRYINSNTHLIEEKCKYPGIPPSMINFNDFDFDEDPKKYNFDINASFSIEDSNKPILTSMTKTINNHLWDRMMVVNHGNDVCWYPRGYEF
jgi:hypothetical protein